MIQSELIATARELNALFDKTRAELKSSQIALCLAKLTVAIEDDDLTIGASFFAELSPEARKLALAGLVLLSNQAFQS